MAGVVGAHRVGGQTDEGADDWKTGRRQWCAMRPAQAALE
jgi:hypothetical protein